jgi:hypothetical protein
VSEPAKPTLVAFYAWQSDLSRKTNRNFIEKALEEALERIRKEGKVHAVLDKDTKGVRGSPHIVETILKKIRNAHVFVADVSFVRKGAKANPDGSKRRYCPNPSVLVELGFALASQGGTDNLVLVMNDAYGHVERLPFDIGYLRALTYSLSPTGYTDPMQRAEAKRKLVDALESALRSAATDLVAREGQSQRGSAIQSAAVAAVAGVDKQAANRGTLVEKFMKRLAADLDQKARLFREQSDPKTAIIEAVGAADELVIGFASVANAICDHGDLDAARVLFRGFEAILQGCDISPTDASVQRGTAYDLHRVIGHELLAIFAGSAIHRERFVLLKSVLDSQLVIDTTHGREPRPWARMSRQAESISGTHHRTEIWQHAQLLKERRTREGVEEVSPYAHLAEGDYFLFLRSWLAPRSLPDTIPDVWIPYGICYFERLHVPDLVVRAQSEAYCQGLADAVGVANVPELQVRYSEATERLRRGLGPTHSLDLGESSKFASCP